MLLIYNSFDISQPISRGRTILSQAGEFSAKVTTQSFYLNGGDKKRQWIAVLENLSINTYNTASGRAFSLFQANLPNKFKS